MKLNQFYKNKELKKQIIILSMLFFEVFLAYILVNNLLNLNKEYLILFAPILIQLIKNTYKYIKGDFVQ